MKRFFPMLNRLLLPLGVLLTGSVALADSRPPGLAAPVAVAGNTPTPTYADLADLADSAPLVVQVQIQKLALVEPDRARGVRAGQARVYIEARTEALIAGATPLGAALRYLADVPLDAKGKLPKLKKQRMVLFARLVPGRPGELQLVSPDAQLAWSPQISAQLRGILTELLAADAPPKITAVREAIHVPGALAGESETQLFLATANGEAAAITVIRQPDRRPQWNISFSEVVAGAGVVPQRDSLPWYRLACFLPPLLSGAANGVGSTTDRVAAGQDYRFVLDELGPCVRTRR